MSGNGRVLIAGAGPAGLAAALSLRKVGFEPLVFEAAPRLLPFGSVLQLWPVGVQGLRELGVGDEILAASGPIHGLDFLTQSGKRLLHAAWDAQDVIAVSRVHLHETLAKAVGDESIRTSSQVVGFEQDDDGVTAKLADGREERGALLIGADGRESRLREVIAGPVEHRYIGKGWGGIVELEDPPIPLGMMWNIFGRGMRFGLVHGRPGVVGWNSMVTDSEDADIGGKKEALETFRGWPEPVEAAIEANAEQAFFVRPIKDFVPIQKWGVGRVTLAGDAAHATTPAQGRGVSEAVEDAITLARLLSREGGLEDGARVGAALRAYEAKRQPPTKSVTLESMRIMRMGVLKNPLAVTGRNVFFRVAGPMISRKMLEDTKRELEPLPAQ